MNAFAEAIILLLRTYENRAANRPSPLVSCTSSLDKLTLQEYLQDQA